MGVIITPQQKIDEYYASDRLSQSVLKELQYGLDKFLATQKKREEDTGEKSYFIIGGAVDTILTGEEGIFEQKYYVSELENKPSDMEMNIISFVFDRIFNNITDNPEEIDFLSEYAELIQLAVDFYGWQPKWKLETRINKIIDVGSDYFEDLKNSAGKCVISGGQKEIIDNIVTSLKENERTSKYFNREFLTSSTEVDIYYQLPLYFMKEDIECKALLDFLIVIKNDGIVVALEPFDIKTMSGYTIEFPNSVRTRRYDIQASWYNDALLNETTIFPEGFPDFNRSSVIMKPFTFIVESSTNPGKPLLFRSNEELLNIGRYGKFNEQTGKQIVKGYFKLLEDYKYYSETEWKEEKVVTDNNGVLNLGWDGIIEE